MGGGGERGEGGRSGRGGGGRPKAPVMSVPVCDGPCPALSVLHCQQ